MRRAVEASFFNQTFPREMRDWASLTQGSKRSFRAFCTSVSLADAMCNPQRKRGGLSNKATFKGVARRFGPGANAWSGKWTSGMMDAHLRMRYEIISQGASLETL
jgi:hypothetical protein